MDVQVFDAIKLGVMQPEIWKALGDYAGKAWSAVGPLVGVLIGAWLARTWDKEKWEKENRKEECRELIKSISHAATLELKVGSGTSTKEAYDAYLESIKTFHDRIFIAKDIEQGKVLDAWAKAVGDFANNLDEPKTFSDRVETVRKTIIGFVIARK